MQFVVLLLAFILAAVIWRLIARRLRRRRLFSTALSQHQRGIVTASVPVFTRLPPDLRKRLEGKMLAFLDQVDFHGCNGLEVSEEMELSVAAQACLLIVNTDAWYTHLRTILIYPGPFRSWQTRQDGYVVTEHETVRLGESWSRGPVVLSWPASEHSTQDYSDGHNVVLHEFAHQLDDLSGATDGAPLMATGQSLREWVQVIGDAYERHQSEVDQGRSTVLDPYGAEGPEEFFAVAVEAFFEIPAVLKADEAAVYAQLATLFRLDPASWGQS